jgi:hypothetical protein
MILFIYQAWERYTTKEWNFSGECLTSKKAQMALNNSLHTHSGLREGIEKRTGIIHGIEELDISMEEECPDDLDIPSRLIIQQALGITISETEGNTNMSENNVSAARLDVSGGLVAATAEEDMWAWNHGKRWGNKPPTV